MLPASIWPQPFDCGNGIYGVVTKVKDILQSSRSLLTAEIDIAVDIIASLLASIEPQFLDYGNDILETKKLQTTLL